MIPIDKGIPIPTRCRGRAGRRLLFPFADMEIGDSFFVAGAASSVESAASRYGQKLGRKFTARYVDGGVRVWRIK